MQTIELTIDGLPPNPNALKGRHWSVVHKQAQEWKSLTGWVAKAKYKGKPFAKAEIHYHISVGDNRVHDADNIIASLKPIQDGLKEIVIEDDSIDNISVSYSFDRAKPRRVRIEIREVPGPHSA